MALGRPGQRALMRLERDVAEGVHRVEDAFTNWCIVEDGGRLTVVDAGVPSSWDSLHAALAELGHAPSAVDAVVLTHAHFDHVGFAERARTELGVPVLVHTNDVPLTKHPWRYDHERPRSRYVLGKPKALPVVAALVRHRAWLAPPIKAVTRYEAGVTLDVPGRPQVVFTPGHTLGHCALHLPDRGVVLAGDAFVMRDPYTARPGPCIVAGAATADSERALASLDALADLDADVAITGHGEPFRGALSDAVDQARAAGPA